LGISHLEIQLKLLATKFGEGLVVVTVVVGFRPGTCPFVFEFAIEGSVGRPFISPAMLSGFGG